jgi:hypothetical protein
VADPPYASRPAPSLQARSLLRRAACGSLAIVAGSTGGVSGGANGSAAGRSSAADSALAGHPGLAIQEQASAHRPNTRA